MCRIRQTLLGCVRRREWHRRAHTGAVDLRQWQRCCRWLSGLSLRDLVSVAVWQWTQDGEGP